MHFFESCNPSRRNLSSQPTAANHTCARPSCSAETSSTTRASPAARKSRPAPPARCPRRRGRKTRARPARTHSGHCKPPNHTTHHPPHNPNHDLPSSPYSFRSKSRTHSGHCNNSKQTTPPTTKTHATTCLSRRIHPVVNLAHISSLQNPIAHNTTHKPTPGLAFLALFIPR